MKGTRQKIPALIAALAVITVSAVSLTGSAVTTVRDATGDGVLTGSDATYTLSYLQGRLNPSSVRSFDFDGNGIISEMDAIKALKYYTGTLSDEGLPGPVGADSQAVATTRSYMRHYFNNSDPSSYSVYSLTVNPFNNTSSNANPVTQNLDEIDYDNRVLDSDTTVVKLTEGSGFIIDDHVIATAAHCIYNTDIDEFYDTTVTIVDNDNDANNIVLQPKYVDMCKAYNSNDLNEDYDYALLYVEEDLSEYGMFNLGVFLTEYKDKNGEVTVSGFPKYLPDGSEDKTRSHRFKSDGIITSDYGGCIRYEAYAPNGTSGGPVYAEEKFITPSGDSYEYRTVIGIHVGGAWTANFAVKITPDLLKFYCDNSNIDY